MLEVWTDGMCEPNPGAGGWGWTRSDGDEQYGGASNTTNNRMELEAILNAMAALPLDTPAIVWSDSMYCVQSYNEWMRGWHRRGWTKPGGLKNADLWQVMWETRLALPLVQLKWIKGHAGHAGNERADKLAAMGREHPGQLIQLTKNSDSPAFVLNITDAPMRPMRPVVESVPVAAGRDYDRTGGRQRAGRFKRYRSNTLTS